MAQRSRVDFLEDVAQLVSKRFPLINLERSAADFSLRLNGHWVSLENLYRASADRQDLLESTVDRWVIELLRAAEGSPDLKAPLDEVRDRVLPMILPAGARGDDDSMMRQMLVSGLTVGYVIDSPHSMAHISRQLAEGWGTDIDDLHELAVRNLLARSQTLAAHAAQDESGQVNLVLVQTLDGYDASRILLPGLYERLREHLGSPFGAAIPNRDILICFRDAPNVVMSLREQVKGDHASMPHQVTDRLFLITPDGLATYPD